MRQIQTAPEYGAEKTHEEGIPCFVPKTMPVTVGTSICSESGKIKEDVKLVEYSLVARIFMTLEQPGISLFGKVVSFIMISMIIVSCACYILQTMPSMQEIPSKTSSNCVLIKGYVCSDYATTGATDCDDDIIETEGQCAPAPLPFFKLIEVIIIVAFTMDYVTRIGTVQFVNDLDAGLVTQEEVIEREVMQRESFSRRRSVSISRGTSLWRVPSSELERGSFKARLRRTFRYAATGFNIIDLIAILPFWLDMLEIVDVSGAAVIRILRLARVFRVFRVGKFNEGLGLFDRTLRASSPALTLLTFFYVIGCVLFGSITYFFEKGEFMITPEYPNGAYLVADSYDQIGGKTRFIPTNFLSIPYCFYWTIVTATTVGYGDMFPHSTPGKIISILCMTCGIITLALPITVIGSNFTREYELLHGTDEEKPEKTEEYDISVESHPKVPTPRESNSPSEPNETEMKANYRDIAIKVTQGKHTKTPVRRVKSCSRQMIPHATNGSVSDTITEDLKAIREGLATLMEAVTAMEGRVRVLHEQQGRQNFNTDEFDMASSSNPNCNENMADFEYRGSGLTNERQMPKETYQGSIYHMSRGNANAGSGNLDILLCENGTKLLSQQEINKASARGAVPDEHSVRRREISNQTVPENTSKIGADGEIPIFIKDVAARQVHTSDDGIRWRQESLPHHGEQVVHRDNSINSMSLLRDRWNHRTLRVTVMEASGIPQVDGVTSCVTVSYGNQRRMTQMMSGMIWNETLEFCISPAMSQKERVTSEHIEFQVYCGNIGVGSCRIPLKEVDGRDHEWVLAITAHADTIVSKPSGRLRLRLSWQHVAAADDGFCTSLSRILSLGEESHGATRCYDTPSTAGNHAFTER